MKNEAQGPSPQESFQNGLISGRITPDEFLDKVLELDQADPLRSAAHGNAALLEQEQVKAKFVGSELEEKYYNLLSFSRFHAGQIEAAKGSNDSALEHFRGALAASEKVKWEGFDTWGMYVRGTIAYLSSKTDVLRLIVKNFNVPEEEVRNREILQNFLQGLEERGSPDYFADYAKDPSNRK